MVSTPAPGLAAAELIFFIVAPMVLCFGSETTTVLTAHQCLRYRRTVLAQHQGFLHFSLCLASERAGEGHGWDS